MTLISDKRKRSTLPLLSVLRAPPRAAKSCRAVKALGNGRLAFRELPLLKKGHPGRERHLP